MDTTPRSPPVGYVLPLPPVTRSSEQRQPCTAAAYLYLFYFFQRLLVLQMASLILTTHFNKES